MASNTLLALLNFSQGPLTPSASQARQNGDSDVKSSDAATPPISPMRSKSSSATANSLLQSILSPTPREQDNLQTSDRGFFSDQAKEKEKGATGNKLPPTGKDTSSKQPQPSSTAQDLLKLLARPTESQELQATLPDDTSLHEQGPRLYQQPIGTPPAQTPRSEQSRSPLPSAPGSAGLLDLLRPSTDSNSRQRSTSNISNGRKKVSKAASQASLLSLTASPTTTYTIDRALHASHHLTKLHADSAFDQAETSGLVETSDEGLEVITLDLQAPQPGGPDSLYPAKIEITPISLLNTAFAPSHYINKTSKLSALARWPCRRVAGMLGKVILYTMSKGRVRLIDQRNGARTLARADSTIRSIIVGEAVKGASSAHFAATTEKGGLFVWEAPIPFGEDGEDVAVTASVFADDGKSFAYACFRPKSKNKELIAVQSDGQVALIKVRDIQEGGPQWSKCKKTELSGATPDEEEHILGMAVSSDGSLMATIRASEVDAEVDAEAPWLNVSLIDLSNPEEIHDLDITFPPAYPFPKNFSFVAFAEDGEDGDTTPRSLILGFNDNQDVAFINLENGTFIRLYQFRAAEGSSFTLAGWHGGSSSLVLGCSIRASLFTLQPRFVALPEFRPSWPDYRQCHQVVERIRQGKLPSSMKKSVPILRESSLPEPYTCIDLDDAKAGGIRVLASHLGGIHSLILPAEAIRQTSLDSSSAAKEESIREEAATLSSHGNVADSTMALTEPTKPVDTANNLPPSTQGNSLPESTTLAAGPPVIDGTTTTEAAGPPVPTPADESRAAPPSVPQEGKKRGGHNRAASRNAKANKNAAASQGGDTSARPAGDVFSSTQGPNNEEMKAMLSAMESSIVAKIQAVSSVEGSRSDNRALTDDIAAKLLPHLQEMINTSVQAELQRGIEASLAEKIPEALHNLMLSPDLNSHLTRSITTSILPPIQRTAMDVISRAVAPHFEGVMNGLASRVEEKIDMGMIGIRKDIVAEQGKALLETESAVQEMQRQIASMTQSLESIARQNVELKASMQELREEKQKANAPTSVAPTHLQQAPSSLTAASPSRQGGGSQDNPYGVHPGTQHAPGPSGRQMSYHYAQPPQTPMQQTSTPYMPLPPPLPSQFNPPTMMAPVPPPAPAKVQPSGQEVEDTLLSALSSANIERDITPLKEATDSLSTRCGSAVDAIWDTSAPGINTKPKISQAVILTLLHRLISSLHGSNLYSTMSPEAAVPWIEACASALDRQDPSIARFFDNVKGNMVKTLYAAHSQIRQTGRASWWTDERCEVAIVRYLR